MNGGPSSFNNALVTKAFVIASALFTIFFGIQGRFNSLGLTYQRNYSAPVQSALEPLEDSIAMLVSIGFGRNLSRQALVQARNDVNEATNILLEAQSH